MGCDIHLYVEKLNEHKEWELVPPPEDAKYGEWFGDRNYSLFAMLADVRNGVGFAGVDTGNRVEPIAMPRGIPKDASEEYAEIAGPYKPCELGSACLHEDGHGGWGEDGHSHTWFTLRELQAVNWEQPITHRGWVTPSQYAIFKRDGKPQGWSGGVSGSGIQHLSNEDMDLLITNGGVVVDLEATGWVSANHYTQVQWTETWRDCLEWTSPEGVRDSAWFDMLDRLSLLTLDDGSDIRICMFFDS